jgi:membrane-bound lytic murein transglycosylase B
LDAAFKNFSPIQKVVDLDRYQPESTRTFTQYIASTVPDSRVNEGRRLLAANRALLEKISTQYGVPVNVIVALWGMETSYGSYMGNFPVVQSLATLAYDSNRKDFFRKQLFYALQILNDGHVSLDHFKGEWAGASGQPQFLPSSWMKYAVDYDHDGRRDIWDSKADVFASIANYMKINGWHTDEPWANYVILPTDFDQKLEGKDIIKSVQAWNALGIKMTNGKALPHQDLKASIIAPNGGPVFLAYPNYRMILRYNNSTYYAGAVGYLADQICKRIN